MSIPPCHTFDDLLLVPQYSEIKSRADVDTTSKLTKSISLKSPVVSANMDTVTEAPMAIAMHAAGGVGIIHRFLTIAEQGAEVKKAKDVGALVGAAIGTSGDYLERAIHLKDCGADFLCLDVAHGHNKYVGEALLKIVEATDLEVIAGNVATADGAKFLIDHGASAVKVGIGPGSACLTRVVAGVGIPQFSAIVDCSMIAHEHGIPVIADGGIRYPGDVAKAIGGGANTVMVGNLLARTVEAPGQVIETSTGSYKTYRGMASAEAMLDKDETLGSSGTQLAHTGRVTPEGVSGLVPFDPRNTAARAVREIVGGLQSAMSYSNSVDIETFHSSARFVTVTNAGITESGAHDVIV